MKTMPRPVLRILRLTVRSLLTVVQWWEDRHGDHTDYRMRELNTGLWQASQSLKAIAEGDFQPMLRQTSLRRLAEVMPERAKVSNRYARELFSDTPVPLRPVD